MKRRFGARRASESRYQKRDVSVLVTLNIAEVCASFLSAQALGCDLRTAETRCGSRDTDERRLLNELTPTRSAGCGVF